MAVTYQRLWALLGERHMRAAKLRQAAGIAPDAMTKLRHDEIIGDVPEREAE